MSSSRFAAFAFAMSAACVVGCSITVDGLPSASGGAGGSGGAGEGGRVAGAGGGGQAAGAGGAAVGGRGGGNFDAGPGDPMLPCAGATGVGKAPGETCACGGECATGHCVDGVCCEEACQGACRTCKGTEGRCQLTAAGAKDPRGSCAVEPPSTCGTSGLCDGRGSCAKYAVGTACGSAGMCDGTEFRAAPRCDERGLCSSASSDCSPYRCTASACRTACDVDGDCAPGLRCINRVCEGPRSIGTGCTAANQCASGFCVDGVCCESACEGTCRSCALANERGRCRQVPANALAARGECPAQAASTCGRTGACDAQGRCALHPMGTTCDPGGCSNATFRALSTCNGAGACQAGAMNSCAPFQCGGSGQCLDRCGADTGCVAPNVCVLGGCRLNPIVDVPLAAAAPVVDGVVDPLWENVPARALGNLVVGNAQGNFDATFRAVWTPTALYVLVVVRDPDRVNDDPTVGSYDDDGVEIYLDADGSRRTSLDGVNDHHILFAYKDPMAANVSLRRTEGFGFAQTETNQGYIIETSMPWSTLGTTGRAGAVLGLDVQVNDDDDDGLRERKIAWFGTEDVAYRDPSSYGRVRLAP